MKFFSYRSTWYRLIRSLAVLDLISAINSPLLTYGLSWGYETWKLPKVLCKVSQSIFAYSCENKNTIIFRVLSILVLLINQVLLSLVAIHLT